MTEGKSKLNKSTKVRGVGNTTMFTESTRSGHSNRHLASEVYMIWEVKIEVQPTVRYAIDRHSQYG